MRTTERDCAACAQTTTHEIVGEAMGEYKFACLRCRELDAEAAVLADKARREAEVARRAQAMLRPTSPDDPRVKAEIAANKAKNRTRDIVIGLLIVVGAIAVFALSKQKDAADAAYDERTIELHGSGPADDPMERLIGEMERMRDRMCACPSLDCKSPIMTNRIRVAADVGYAARGTEEQRLRLERVEQRFNECYTRPE